jgi:hypothetical protein
MLSSLRQAIKQYPIRAAAIGTIAVTASFAFAAVVPELLRYVKIRRM